MRTMSTRTLQGLCLHMETENGLGVVHNCQCLNKCTKYTLSQTPFPSKMYTSTFFKWKICHENKEKKELNIDFFPHFDTPSP